MNKFSAKTIALIVVLVILAAAAWFMFGGSVSGGLNYANADKYTVGDTTVTSPVENLDIDWTSGPVNIEYHAGSGISVSETANKTLSEDDRLRWWLDGTTLRIRYAKSGIRFSFNLEKKLTVSLPEGTVLKQPDIGTTSGDLFIPALAADDIRLNSTSGSVSLDVAGTAEEVKAGSTSGNISPVLASVNKADFSSTSGCFSGSVRAFQELKIHTTSGKVDVKLPAEPGFTCKVDSSSGDLTTALSLAKNGNQYTCGDGSARCSIDTSSGDITLGKAD